MLSLRKTYFWILWYLLVIQLVAPHAIKLSDEVGMVFILITIFFDMVINRQFRRYRMLLIVIGIMAFYAVYTLLFHHFNTTSAVLLDFFLQCKPFVGLFGFYAIAPRFIARERQILRITSVAVVLLSTIQYWGLWHFEHGHAALISALTYLFASVEDDGSVKPSCRRMVMVILALGLLCTRSKFYGETTLTVFMLFFYRPGMFRRIKPKQIVILSLLLGAIIAVAWKKISYYYLGGAEELFEIDALESYARPALFMGMLLVLADYPLLGSGLASYASYGSAWHYSLAYYEYGLDKVWGLSEDYGDFICDNFVAQFAQVGIVGFVLFVAMFVWAYRKLRLVLHDESSMLFAIGIVAIATVPIESVGGTYFQQWSGFYVMSLLGLIIGRYRDVSPERRKEILQQDCKKLYSTQ